MAAKKKKTDNPNEVIDLSKNKVATEYLKVITEDYEDVEEDVITIREYDKDPKFTIVTKDPHGYSYITSDKNKVPAELSGAYTTFILAKNALDAYLKRK